MSPERQIVFQVCLTLLWISYYLAIVIDPGSPPKNFEPQQGEWRRWCKKCENYKPERTHHCKTCKKCVLKMDHHCPWTYNCVGHGNLPHFMRFLFWVIFCTSFVFIELSKRALQYYRDSNLPSYLISKIEMVAVITLLPLDFFVLITISILFIRCIINMVFRGMTQIEVWEKERIESQLKSGRIWAQIKKNYRILHGKDMPRLISWSKHSRYYEEEGMEAVTESEDMQVLENEHEDEPWKDFTIDDLVFPYDLGMWINATDACGTPLVWLVPFGSPKIEGFHFNKNEFVEDDQLGLPWPPDGGHQENIPIEDEEIDGEGTQLEDLGLAEYKRRLFRDPRVNLSRNEWMNDLGETLDDFGVDLEAEDAENDQLIAK